MTGKSVVITGAAGFIGRYASREFARHGWTVVGIGRGEFPDWRDWGVSVWYGGDLSVDTLLAYIGKPDAIVHCAGGSSVGRSIENPAADFESTVTVIFELLEFVRVHSPDTKLVYLSSAAVYGQSEMTPISETNQLAPVSPYGAHKQIAETLCQLYARQFNVSVVIVRLFSIYGEGLKKQLLWDACNKLIRGEFEFFGSGREVRDWLHVSDAVNLLMVALNYASSKSPIVNGGTGKGVSVSEALNYLAGQLGLNTEISFSAVEKEGDPLALIADISIAQGWGWRPQVDWRVGVARYAQWFLGSRN